MSFDIYFKEQLERHSSMQYQDAVKLCYQAAFGAEHLLSDLDRARVYLEEEYSSVSVSDEPLFERISDDVCRVNLGAWKREDFSIKALFEAFISSASIREDAKDAFLSYLGLAGQIMESEKRDFDKDAWRAFLEEYKGAGMPPLHHSIIYREREKPSYRIVAYKYLCER